MPLPLPNILIHLSALVRPRLLRPDLRVPTIGHVDFRALRKVGFNAVVVDKDNCLTLPEQDGLYPPLQEGWTALLGAFGPGRVLIVSNSAGTKKDPSLSAAERVTRNLRAPILSHPTPKPACAPLILKYFRGELGRPRLPVLIPAAPHPATEVIEESSEARALREAWATGPLLGPPETSSSSSNSNDEPSRNVVASQPPQPRDYPPPPPEAPEDNEDLRILVVGDRLFTDTLLAWRLRLLLGMPPADEPARVLSIQTVSLPRPDQRILRMLENVLSLGKLRNSGKYDWTRYALPGDDLTLTERLFPRLPAWRGIKVPFLSRRLGARSDGLIGAPLLVKVKRNTARAVRATARGTERLLRTVWNGLVSGVVYVWARARRRLEAYRAERAARLVTSGAASAEVPKVTETGVESSSSAAASTSTSA